MATNTLAGFGLRPVRNAIAASPTYQASIRKIKTTYTGAIGFGDLVMTGDGGSGFQGYVIIGTASAGRSLGVFAGCLPFYNPNLAAYSNLAGWPSGGVSGLTSDVEVMVYDSPLLVYQAQLSGTWAESYRGQNINFTAGTNGVPGAAPSYTSTLTLDATTIALDNTLPFKILGLAQNVSGSPLDIANTNPAIEVILNTAELAASIGV